MPPVKHKLLFLNKLLPAGTRAYSPAGIVVIFVLEANALLEYNRPISEEFANYFSGGLE